MSNVTQLFPSTNQQIIEELLVEWLNHKRCLSFERFIAERMPLWFGPLSSNQVMIEKIRQAERHTKMEFHFHKGEKFWHGSLKFEGEEVQLPNFIFEDDLRLFAVLSFLKLSSTKKPG